MRHASHSARPQSEDGPTAVGEQTCTFLRKLYPRATAENVAADLKAWRVKSATVAKMLERSSTPGTAMMLALTCRYGPSFLCAVLASPPAWLDAAKAEQERAAIRAEIEALETRLERL